MLISLCDWEDNGYHDSYFYEAVYDTDKDSIYAIQTGATSYAGGCSAGQETKDTSLLVCAYLCLERYIFNFLLKNYERMISAPMPDEINKKTLLRTNKACRCKNYTVKICEKCMGRGEWENPNRSGDRRECFGCKGDGEKVIKGEGWKGIPKGEEFEVIRIATYGKFYSNGYNKPSRSNTTIYGNSLRIGRISVKLENCQLVEYLDKAQLRDKAHKMACDGQFQKATGIKCAWLSNHYAPCPIEFRQKV